MSNPKEKAIELVDKFKAHASWHEFELVSEEICLSNAKQCALIAVDEMIEQNGELYLINVSSDDFAIQTIDYYKSKNAFLFDVKTEIEKL